MQISSVTGERQNVSAKITVAGHLPSPAYSITSTKVQQSEGAFEIDFQVANRGGMSAQVLKKFTESVMLGRTFPGSYSYRILNNGELVVSGQIDLT